MVAAAVASASAIGGTVTIAGAEAGIEYAIGLNRLHYQGAGRTQYTTAANRLHLKTKGRTQYSTAGRVHYQLEND
tara:strand:- start:567 stop:791 length:225 start_codon:yes stop_codon:yes gene_type:complete